MKKIIAFLIFPIFLFADYEFIVETPEIADSYFNIFNGIAMIFNSSDYMALLRMVFLFGGFATFTLGIINSWGKDGKSAISDYTKYTLAVVATLSILFSNSTTIWVKSKTLPTFCNPTVSSTAGFAVANIPTVLAYGFNFSNRLGREMTSLAESVYSVPGAQYGDTTMDKNGGYVGALKHAMGVLSMDMDRVTLKQDINGTNIPFDVASMSKKILSDCILVPFSGKGQEGLDQIANLKSSSNIPQYLDNLYSNASATSIGGTFPRDYSLEYGGQTWACGTFYDYIKPYFQKFKNQVVCSYPNVTAGAIQILTNVTADSMVTGNFQDVAIQSGLVTQLEASVNSLGIATQGVAYLNGKSKADFINSSMSKGLYMAEMLPYLQMTIRAILYAFFPFCFVIIILPGGFAIIKQYMQSIIWVELWSPTAAILNMFVMQNAQTSIGGIVASEGMTLSNSVDLLSTGSTIAGIASYLYMSVPALTWLILKGSATMLTNITSGLVGAAGASAKMNNELNQDFALKKAQEGTSFGSIAEYQHFQANLSGTKDGALNAFYSDVGANKVANTALLKEVHEIGKFNEAMKANHLDSNNVQSTIQAGTASAKTDAINDAAKMKAGFNMTGEMIHGSSNYGANEILGKTNAQANNPLDSQTFSNAYTQSTITKIETDSATDKKLNEAGFNIQDRANVGSDKAVYDTSLTNSFNQKMINEYQNLNNAGNSTGLANGINTAINNSKAINTEIINPNLQDLGKKQAQNTITSTNIENYKALATNLGADAVTLVQTTGPDGSVTSSYIGANGQNFGETTHTAASNIYKNYGMAAAQEFMNKHPMDIKVLGTNETVTLNGDNFAKGMSVIKDLNEIVKTGSFAPTQLKQLADAGIKLIKGK